MMQTEQITYRPQYGADSYVKDSNVRFSDNLTIYQTSYNSIFFLVIILKLVTYLIRCLPLSFSDS